MNFGEFDESNLFHIENSKIYRDLGDGIKTVEFILKYKEDSIIFLEANDFKINVNGFINNDEIIFNNDNIDYKFDINSLLFVRKSDEFTSLLDFNNKESIYYLNE